MTTLNNRFAVATVNAVFIYGDVT